MAERAVPQLSIRLAARPLVPCEVRLVGESLAASAAREQRARVLLASVRLHVLDVDGCVAAAGRSAGVRVSPHCERLLSGQLGPPEQE